MRIKAKWITSPRDAGAAAVTFKKSFRPQKPVSRAVLYASAMGVYVPYINGQKVGRGVLAPGWTSYRHRVQYQTYDVTDAVQGKIELSFGVGQGWAVGYIGYADTNHFFADRTALWGYLDVTYADGTTERMITDESWDVYTSAITSSEIYHGETIDLTAPITLIGKAVERLVETSLIPQEGEWITEQERLAPVEIIHTPAGETVIDFGQNMTGYVEVRVKGERGDRIVLHHAEVLDHEGNFYTENYRAARNENVFVLSGGEDVFKPLYSFQGFRYVKLVEYPFDTVDPNCFRAVAVHSEMKRTGHFVCGNEKINQLYHNIIWGQKSNYLDVPTDCPQRDERLGWTGDTQVFCRTAAINYDVEKFFIKWLGDVALEQTREGAVYGIVPHCLGKGNRTRISAAWGDVACIAPWQMYLAYGNREELRKNLPMMKKWVDYLHSAGPEEFLWMDGVHYGDWLAMDGNPEEVRGATSNDLIASAFFAYSTELLVKAGEVLGEDMTYYRKLYDKVVEAFRIYFMKDGMPLEYYPLTGNEQNAKADPFRQGMTQTAIVLILHFGLCKEDERAALAEKLAEMIRANGNRMTTGFVGTPYLLHALSDNGYTDLAYTLLLQEKNPSWLYSVTHGATTMWEHWNSLKEDGTFWSKSMNSFNHYAYGAVFDWIFGVAVGIAPVAEAPAYKTVRIAPHPSKVLGFADASIDSRQGKIRVHWYYKGDTVYYEIEIPDGVTANLTLPSGHSETLAGGSYCFAEYGLEL